MNSVKSDSNFVQLVFLCKCVYVYFLRLMYVLFACLTSRMIAQEMISGIVPMCTWFCVKRFGYCIKKNCMKIAAKYVQTNCNYFFFRLYFGPQINYQKSWIPEIIFRLLCQYSEPYKEYKKCISNLTFCSCALLSPNPQITRYERKKREYES